MRCDVHGTSWHVTTKSSIRDWCAFYKSGAYARQSSVSYPGRPVQCSLNGMAGILWHRRETRRKPRRQMSACSREKELKLLRESLTAVQESAEGIVGGLPLKARTAP